MSRLEELRREGRPLMLLGGSGMLGRALRSRLTEIEVAFTAPRREELDLSQLDEVRATIEAIEPAAIFNASAYTDVGRAEDEAAQAFLINRDLVETLAAIAAERSIPIVHVSTDYVFDGKSARPYREEDPVGPLQVYGTSKYEGEQRLRERCPNALIARTSTLYGPGLRGRRHYVDAILAQAAEKSRIEVVRLPESSPTYAPDLADQLVLLFDRYAHGIVHTVNDGACTRLELATETVRLAAKADEVSVVERPEPEGGLARPNYSVLDVARYARIAGRRPRSWRAALADYVEKQA